MSCDHHTFRVGSSVCVDCGASFPLSLPDVPMTPPTVPEAQMPIETARMMLHRAIALHEDENPQVDALIAAVRAEERQPVAGKWEAYEDEGDWWVYDPKTCEGIYCPDERTARAYAEALNRADHNLEAKTDAP